MQTVIIQTIFALIQALLQYLRDVNVPEEVIEANWEETKKKVWSRPSKELPTL